MSRAQPIPDRKVYLSSTIEPVCVETCSVTLSVTKCAASYNPINMTRASNIWIVSHRTNGDTQKKHVLQSKHRALAFRAKRQDVQFTVRLNSRINIHTIRESRDKKHRIRLPNDSFFRDHHDRLHYSAIRHKSHHHNLYAP